jgi:hypothetical protein
MNSGRNLLDLSISRHDPKRPFNILQTWPGQRSDAKAVSIFMSVFDWQA